MKAFRPTFGRQPWPDGLLALQIYALPDLPHRSPLDTLLTDLRTAMAPFPVLPVRADSFHITLDMVTSAPAEAISDAERRNVVDRLRTALAGTGPIRLQAGSPIAYRTGVRLDLHPDSELAALQHRVRGAVHEVFGPDSTGYPLGVLHMTAAYAAADTDTDELAQAIHRIRPGHAPFTVSRIILNEVYWRRAPLPGHNGLVGRQIGWDTIATIPLDA
ncbi:2'-5' RNA ligase family protein [Kitasatospora sp. NPDC036755]|uniref:2'-5' RNA ligase family protein n=1 Tax=Kitasatospora sp. NPDC036755 TaxID=3154600 RepID=UPI00340BEFD7